MEHLLLELWERRRGAFLTLQAYEECGGVGGAVARRANEVYDGLTPPQRAIARRVLLRLTQPGEGTEDTRRRAEVAELATSPDERAEVDEILEAMSAARLVTLTTDPATGAPAAEVTHEALIRGWPELRAWIEEDREQLRLHRRLTDAAGEWEASGRDDALLYRGSRLDAWTGRPAGDLNDRERAFLDESRGRERRERAARRRRLRLTVGALAGGVVVLAVLAAVALVSRDQAQSEATAARSEAGRALAAQSRLAASTGGDPFTLAQRSLAEAQTDEGAEALRLAAQQPLRRSIPTGHGRLWAVTALSDGRIVTGSESGELQVWDPAAPAAPLASVATGHASVYALLELPDGRILSGNDDGTLEIRDPALGPPVASVQTGHGSLYAAALLPGDRVAIGSGDGWVQVRDLGDLQQPSEGFPTGHEAIDALAVLPGGLLAVGSDDGWLQIFDPARPSRPVAAADTAHGAVYSIEPLPGGRLATSGDAGWVNVWRAGPPLARLGSGETGHGTAWSITALDGGRLALASDDSTLEVRSVSRPERVLERIPTDHGPLLKVVSPAPGEVVTGSDGGQLEVWDLEHARAAARVGAAEGARHSGDHGRRAHGDRRRGPAERPDQRGPNPPARHAHDRSREDERARGPARGTGRGAGRRPPADLGSPASRPSAGHRLRGDEDGDGPRRAGGGSPRVGRCRGRGRHLEPRAPRRRRRAMGLRARTRVGDPPPPRRTVRDDERGRGAHDLGPGAARPARAHVRDRPRARVRAPRRWRTAGS